ncbi:MAG: hypothetical protein ACR2NZ_10805 [Rubripirellula sp.]
MRACTRQSSRCSQLAFLWWAVSLCSLPAVALGENPKSIGEGAVGARVLGVGQSWQTRFYVNDSGVAGPTVIVTGGVHGNEPAGSAAADQIRHWPIVRGKLKSMYYRGKTTTVKMQFTEHGRGIFADVPESCEVSYHNGPIVSPRNDPELSAYTPLAFFRSEQVLYPPQKGTMINTPAIVSGDFGHGKVISISPHCEATKGLESIVVTAAQAVASK